MTHQLNRLALTCFAIAMQGVALPSLTTALPDFNPASTKTSSLHDDANFDGEPTAGDTIRYAIFLENSGIDAGTIDVTDTIPAEAGSWALVSAGGGTNASTASVLSVTGLTVMPGSSVTVLFDVILASVPDETAMSNSATYSAPPEGGSGGSLIASDVIIRLDGDEDTVYDNDDNCIGDANPGQEDADLDGIGDVCDPTPNGEPVPMSANPLVFRGLLVVGLIAATMRRIQR